MSGGFFDYNQHRLEDMAREIENIINNNKYDYKPETLEKFKQAVICLRLASNMVQRIDWLLSDNDSEITFHEWWDKRVNLQDSINQLK